MTTSTQFSGLNIHELDARFVKNFLNFLNCPNKRKRDWLNRVKKQEQLNETPFQITDDNIFSALISSTENLHRLFQPLTYLEKTVKIFCTSVLSVSALFLLTLFKHHANIISVPSAYQTSSSLTIVQQ